MDNEFTTTATSTGLNTINKSNYDWRGSAQNSKLDLNFGSNKLNPNATVFSFTGKDQISSITKQSYTNPKNSKNSKNKATTSNEGRITENPLTSIKPDVNQETESRIQSNPNPPMQQTIPMQQTNREPRRPRRNYANRNMKKNRTDEKDKLHLKTKRRLIREKSNNEHDGSSFCAGT